LILNLPIDPKLNSIDAIASAVRTRPSSHPADGHPGRHCDCPGNPGCFSVFGPVEDDRERLPGNPRHSRLLDDICLFSNIPSDSVLGCCTICDSGAHGGAQMLKQNTIQLTGNLVFNGCTLAYSIFQYLQLNTNAVDAFIVEYPSSFLTSEWLKVLLLLIVAVLGACLSAFLYLAWKLYNEFGWQIYKRIGADPHMKRAS
jgi:hypothetical protein